MSGRRGWLVLGGLASVVVALAVLRPGGQQGSPDHRSSSDAADGTSALRSLATALGHPTHTLEGSFNLPGTSGLLFVFTPSTPFAAQEATQLQQWVTSGGVLVYASERGDPQLDAKLALKRAVAFVPAEGSPPAPLLGGVRRVKGGQGAIPLEPGLQQVPLLRNRDGRGDVLAVSQHMGRGRMIALADPLVLCNGFLKDADNGRLAADLLALVVSTQPVAFDEFHHELNAQRSSGSWLTAPWGLAAFWAALVVAAGLALRGRAFGPWVSIAPRQDRSAAEYTMAVGTLLRRAGARALTLEVLTTATRRALAERVGLGRDASLASVPAVLKERAPALADELAKAEAGLREGSTSEPAFLQAARRLHGLARPVMAKPAPLHSSSEESL